MATALHDVIDARRPLLTERYAAELERRMALRAGASTADVLDDFAAFINQIVYRLRRASGRDAPEPSLENASRLHGAQRFQLGADLASLIGEYALIRRLIVELAAEEALALTNQEVIVLGEALDDGVRAATLEFVGARDAERRKDEVVRETFIGILGHDLQSPLNAVFAGASMLLRHEMDESHTRVTRRILSSAERMGRMIRDLLDFARGRAADGIPLQPGVVELRDLCREVADELRLASPGAQPIEIKFEGATRGEWDRDRLAQAVGNLLSNALTYGAPDRPAGLGLFITKQIVVAHGGTIRAASSAGQGTTFTFELPVRRAAEGAPGTPAPHAGTYST